MTAFSVFITMLLSQPATFVSDVANVSTTLSPVIKKDHAYLPDGMIAWTFLSKKHDQIVMLLPKIYRCINRCPLKRAT